MIHTGEKPFECGECYQQLSKGSNLKQHQTIHTGEMAFKCHECNKLFSKNGDLKRHQILHREKALTCDWCGK